MLETIKKMRSRYAIRRGIAVRQCETPNHRAILSALEATRHPRSAEFAEVSARIEARRSSLIRSKVRMHAIDMSVSQRTRASKDPYWCRFLYELCRAVRPRSVLEMGTCVGISGSYLGAALEEPARFITLEGDAETAAIAQETLKDVARCVIGQFDDTLTKAAAELAPIGFVFEDGHHDETATLRYFDQLLPFIASDAVVVFDDITWSDGMKRAWRTIQRHSSVGSVFDLRNVGVVTVHANSTVL